MKMIAAALMVALAGCASSSPTRWQKAGGGGNQIELDNDIAQCNAQAFAIPGGNLNQVAIVRQQCMFGKGWRIM
ncbi:MAG: hypothetical protein KF822_09650 [Steroidobacteraceae bacterium]|nr:hypothetical protein [Steroidobacteraceae bacterium]